MNCDDGEQEPPSTVYRYVSDAARYACDFASIGFDLERAVEALEALLELPEDEAHELRATALWVMAVSFYSRCFRTGKRATALHHLEELLAVSPERARQVHEEVMGWRDRHLAHSVSALERSEFVVEVTECADGRAKVNMRPVVVMASGPTHGDSLPRLFRDVAKVLAARVDLECKQWLQVAEEEITSRDLRWIRRLAQTDVLAVETIAAAAWRQDRKKPPPRPAPRAAEDTERTQDVDNG